MFSVGVIWYTYTLFPYLFCYGSALFGKRRLHGFHFRVITPPFYGGMYIFMRIFIFYIGNNRQVFRSLLYNKQFRYIFLKCAYFAFLVFLCTSYFFTLSRMHSIIPVTYRVLLRTIKISAGFFKGIDSALVFASSTDSALTEIHSPISGL